MFFWVRLEAFGESKGNVFIALLGVGGLVDRVWWRNPLGSTQGYMSLAS